MRVITAHSQFDGGVVEIAPRDVQGESEHGYFLGVRDQNNRGAFVELTRAEAEEVAKQLTSRWDRHEKIVEKDS